MMTLSDTWPSSLSMSKSSTTDDASIASRAALVASLAFSESEERALSRTVSRTSYGSTIVEAGLGSGASFK